MPWVNSRQNLVDVEYGRLMGVDASGCQYIYLTDNMIGDGLVWQDGQVSLNGSIISKIDLLKLLIDDLKLDLNLSAADILLLINEVSNNTELLNQIYSLVKPKDPIIIYKEFRTVVKEYIEIRTTKYVSVKCDIVKPDRVEVINTGSTPPSNTGGWSDSGKGYLFKQGKYGRKYFKINSTVYSEKEFYKYMGWGSYKKPIHHNWNFPTFK